MSILMSNRFPEDVIRVGNNKQGEWYVYACTCIGSQHFNDLPAHGDSAAYLGDCESQRDAEVMREQIIMVLKSALENTVVESS